MKANIYSAGRFKTVLDIPGLGSYDLVSGQGHGAGQYVKSPWAFACMQIRATALAQIPWRITRNDEVLESHPLLELLDNFGPENNWADAFRATEIDMLLKGAAFWLKDADRLVRLNPNTMKVETTTSGIQGFKQTILSGGRTFERTYSREEVIYFREFHPTDDLGFGVAKCDVAKNAILAEYESQRYIRAFFENDAIPGLLLRTEQEVPQDAMKKLADWWDVKFRGANKHHKVAFVDKGLEAQILSTDLRAMALEEVRDQARRDICTAFAVPMVLVGDLDAANFATAHEARMSLMQEVILPRADYYADVINSELVQAQDPNVTFEFATDELEILAEDKNEKADRLIKLLNAKAIDVVFLREELGIPEDAGPTPEEIDAEKQAEREQAGQDLGRWQKKAQKALRAGKSADVSFDTQEVAPALQAAIRVRLGKAKTASDIERVFSDAPG